MSEAEVRVRLEKASHKKITLAEWEYLKRSGWIREFLGGQIGWRDFRDIALELLDSARRFHQDTLREQSGMFEMQTKFEADLEPTVGQPDATSGLSKRTFARVSALSALNHLRAGELLAPRPFIRATHKPRGAWTGRCRSG